MKHYTPFQAALLDGNARAFADIPEESAIDLTPSPRLTARLRDIHPPRPRATLRRCLIAVAAALALALTVAATVHLSLGAVKIEERLYTFPAELEADPNRGYTLIFDNLIPNTSAPAFIETYYLPQYGGLSDEALFREHCFLSSATETFYQYKHPSSSNRPIENIIATHYEWRLNTKTNESGLFEGNEITFDQRTARSVQEGQGLLNIQMDADINAEITTETIPLGNFQVYCLTLRLPLEGDNRGTTLNRYWFWTDGDYVFQLFGSNGVTRSQMEKLFYSVAPTE